MGSCKFGTIVAVALTLGMPAFARADEHPGASAGAFSSMATGLLVVYCGMIALSSLGGGFLPMLVRLTHRRMQLLVSLVGGLMLGVGIFHQLPHAVAVMPNQDSGHSSALDSCMWWLMFGLLLTFFMLRMFHFHNHGPMADEDGHDHDCAHDHDHDHAGQLSHDHDHGHGAESSKKASWIGIFLGLSLHTLLDGVALAAAVEADAIHQHGNSAFALLGLGTFLGVVLHKPLDSLSITSLMATGGWSRGSMQLANIGYALMCPIGAGLFCVGMTSFSGGRDTIVAGALAMSAGVFIAISLSDLLPEVQFHSHDRIRLSLVLLLGVALAWGIRFLEPAHTHGASGPSTINELKSHDDHQHDGHDHHDHTGHKH